MTLTRKVVATFVAETVAVLALASPAALAEHFDSTLSSPQIELKFRRIRDAHELKIDGALPWVYAFSGPDSAKVEALSLRLVRDGFRIVSLQSAGGVTVLRVERSELHNPATLEHRNRELAKLARLLGVPSYDGADVGPAP
jgi:hypothetical protein